MVDYIKERKDGKLYAPNWRTEKKYMRLNATYFAWLQGQEAAELPVHRQRNPYPPGARHTEFWRGLELGRLEMQGSRRREENET